MPVLATVVSTTSVSPETSSPTVVDVSLSAAVVVFGTTEVFCLKTVLYAFCDVVCLLSLSLPPQEAKPIIIKTQIKTAVTLFVNLKPS